jgi:hypothetical protein
MLVYIIFSSLIFVLIPAAARAWGPGTHIEIALSLLEKLALMAPAVRMVVAGRRDWFIYGSVAADIIVGKKYAGEHEHCHNWKAGFSVLKHARTDREKAAAYGYLAHLAADVIAHNYFIPYKIVKSWKAHTLSHTYWEMRFDAHVRKEVWEEMKRMIIHDFGPFDNLLRRRLRHALFSFHTSKAIFNGILALHRFKHFRTTFAIHAKRSKHKLDIRDVKDYMRLAAAAAISILSDPGRSNCLKFDPTGREKIAFAQAMRRRLKRTGGAGRRQIAIIKQELYKDIEPCSYSSQRR